MHLKLLFITAFFTIGSAFAGNRLSKIEVDGNRFVDENGTTMIFRGLNTSDPDKLQRDGHWNEEYFEEMKKWGANVVRFPVHPPAWKKHGDEAYLKLLDDGIKWAGERGMYVIIDWHIIGNLKSEKFMRDIYITTKEETFRFWDVISNRYKDNPVVAFFELYNEPTLMNGELGECTWEELKTLHEKMIGIIRNNGAEAIPLVSGFNWAYDLTMVSTNPVDAENIAYVSHPYPQKRDQPWEEKWTNDWGFVAKKYPVFLTEIGYCLEGERGAHIPVISDDSYGEAITRYTAEHGISYVVWVFDPNWSPMLFSDWDFTPTTQGRFFKNALQNTEHIH